MKQALSAAVPLTLASMLLACGAAPSSAHGPETVASSTVATGAETPPRAAASSDAGTPKPHVHVHELRGSEDRDLDPVLSPTLQRQLEGCHRSGSAKFTVRVRREGGRLTFEGDQASSLDPTERACVLEALRREEVAAALSTGATVPPTGFTSLLSIEW